MKSTIDRRPPLSATELRRQRERIDLDANALELYARVVAAGSFAHAARQLGLTRAAVSRRVAAIEDRVGQALFARTTRSLGLTDAGRQLARRAQAVREAADAARQGWRRGAESLEGLLRITSVPSFGVHVLMPLLRGFQQQHPGVQFECLFTDRRLDLLRESVDVAFRITQMPPLDWVAQPVMRFRIGAYGTPGPALPDPQALAQQPLLLLGGATEALNLNWLHDNGGRQSVTVSPALCADSLDALLTVARLGGGVALAPDFCAQADVEAGRLADRLPGWQLPIAEGNEIQALTLPAAAAGVKARALVHWVSDALTASHTAQFKPGVPDA
ncbi:LysR family transcriptional regulator [Inhella gelatinilytica]|uniref:LysR family transcriptional regulator n=1 Tax=Inhella gelatinilytica TaxID=2795030 RepID=A0A931NEJ4_9BURK|nr:LysR family transcriptional regulator [Inhella gelatinilytica]MBH9554222.1 LysR family transcriptional regulator [Inhella gelatinilytica]